MTDNPFNQDAPAASGKGAEIDLSAFDDDFAAAQAPEYEELPDGKYQARIDKAALTRTRSSGEPMIRWELVVISGAHESRRIFKNSVFSAAALPFIKADFLKLGIELARLSELPGRLGEALDKTLEVSVKTRDDHRNCYFNKLLDIPAGQTDVSDIPF